MATIARISIEDNVLPLSPEDRGMLVKSLRDIADKYEKGTYSKVVLHYIDQPKTYIKPITSQNCSDG